MRKTIYTLLLAVLCASGATHGQVLATWSLTQNGNGSAPGNTVQASKLNDGNGITPPTFSSSGASSFAWESSQEASAEDYFEVCIEPKPNFTLNVSSLSFTESRSSDGIRAYDVAWSKDGFQTATLLASFNVPDDENARTNTLGSLNINVCKGETLCFRWYGYQAEDNDGIWRLRDISIGGDAPPLCPNPNQIQSATSFVINNVSSDAMDVSWVRGNGNGIVVLARAGAAPEFSPCGWQNITASPVFGLGTLVGDGTYVVYDGTGTGFTLLGLAQGTRYYLEAYEYYTPGYCLIRMPSNLGIPKANAQTLCSPLPDPINSLRHSPTGQAMYLSWALPPCYDQIMVVASTQPITALPTSMDTSLYLADTLYGAGTDGNGDFLPPAYPVYRDTSRNVKVTGLINGQDYYFRVFTFRDDQWAAGAQVSARPEAGCAELRDGGRVFINEIHYNNFQVDVDEGFEIVGQAGTDLSNYALALYAANRRKLDRLIPLQGIIGDEGQGYGAIWVPVPDIFEQGGIALYNLVADVVVEFLTWRDNSFTADDGPAEGLPAIPIGVREGNPPNATPLNHSLQRIGSGLCPASMSWQGPMLSSRGLINVGQALLPIQLRYFEGQLVGERVRLHWATASEENNDYMAVEHSMDARSFKEIGRVKGAGSTALPQDYQLWHERPLPGLNYYRLRQVDFDGKFEIFSTIAILYRPGNTVFQLYPTLAAHRLTVELSTPGGSPGELVLFNLYGQPLQRIAVPEGGLRQEISVEALPPGHYLLQWRPQAGEHLVQRFVKQ